MMGICTKHPGSDCEINHNSATYDESPKRNSNDLRMSPTEIRTLRLNNPGIVFSNRSTPSSAAKALRAAGKYTEAEILDGQKDLHPQFDLAARLASAEARNKELENIVASTVNVQASVRKMELSEKKLMARYKNFLNARGVPSLLEFEHTDSAFSWARKVWIGEAKYVKKGGQTVVQAVRNSLKVLHYAEQLKHHTPGMFVLFNTEIPVKEVSFLVRLGITVIAESKDGFVFLGGDPSIEEMLDSYPLSEVAYA